MPRGKQVTYKFERNNIGKLFLHKRDMYKRIVSAQKTYMKWRSVTTTNFCCRKWGLRTRFHNLDPFSIDFKNSPLKAADYGDLQLEHDRSCSNHVPFPFAIAQDRVKKEWEYQMTFFRERSLSHKACKNYKLWGCKSYLMKHKGNDSKS